LLEQGHLQVNGETFQSAGASTISGTSGAGGIVDVTGTSGLWPGRRRW